MTDLQGQQIDTLSTEFNTWRSAHMGVMHGHEVATSSFWGCALTNPATRGYGASSYDRILLTKIRTI